MAPPWSRFLCVLSSGAGYLSFRGRTALADGVCLVGCARAYVYVSVVCGVVVHVGQWRIFLSGDVYGNSGMLMPWSCACLRSVGTCSESYVARPHRGGSRYLYSVCVRGGPSVLCVVDRRGTVVLKPSDDLHMIHHVILRQF